MKTKIKPARTYRRARFQLKVTPNGRQYLIAYKKRHGKSLLKDLGAPTKEYPQAGSAYWHKGSIFAKKSQSGHVKMTLQEFDDLIKQRKVFPNVFPKPLAIFKSKDAVVIVTENLRKLGYKKLREVALTRREKKELFEKVRNIGEKLVQKGLWPFDFSPEIGSLFIKKTMQGIRIKIIDSSTSIFGANLYNITDTLKELDLHPPSAFEKEVLLFDKEFKKFGKKKMLELPKWLWEKASQKTFALQARYYSSLPLATKIKLQKAILTYLLQEFQKELGI